MSSGCDVDRISCLSPLSSVDNNTHIQSMEIQNMEIHNIEKQNLEKTKYRNTK